MKYSGQDFGLRRSHVFTSTYSRWKLSFQAFLADSTVAVMFDNTTVLSYLNKQGGTVLIGFLDPEKMGVAPNIKPLCDSQTEI